MTRLMRSTGREIAEDIGSEVAARGLVLRLCELLGGTNPDWEKDTSVFPAGVMKQIVDYIDAHLHKTFCLKDFSVLVGLSESHFAKKLRHTEGISLGRFINRRRLSAAMIMLRSDSRPLAQVALDLGFSSQSHFTRLFSDLTGMTPARYRKVFKRTIG